jgi:hypothetical protein
MTLCHQLSYLLHIAPIERGWRHPLKRYGHLFRTRPERCRDIRLAGHVFPVTSALCGHPRHCAAIPGVVASSPTLWEPRSTRHRHAHRCAISGLPSAEPSNWRTDGNQTRAPALLPSKLPLDGHRIHHDARQRQDSPGQLSTLRHCAPCCRTYHLEPHVMTVIRLPLAYKRRRWSPGHEGMTNGNPLAFSLSPTILALCLNQPSGPGGSPSSPASLVAPLYEHHGALQYNATSASLLDIQPAARTRINPVS